MLLDISRDLYGPMIRCNTSWCCTSTREPGLTAGAQLTALQPSWGEIRGDRGVRGNRGKRKKGRKRIEALGKRRKKEGKKNGGKRKRREAMAERRKRKRKEEMGEKGRGTGRVNITKFIIL